MCDRLRISEANRIEFTASEVAPAGYPGDVWPFAGQLSLKVTNSVCDRLITRHALFQLLPIEARRAAPMVLDR